MHELKKLSLGTESILKHSFIKGFAEDNIKLICGVAGALSPFNKTANIMQKIKEYRILKEQYNYLQRQEALFLNNLVFFTVKQMERKRQEMNALKSNIIDYEDTFRNFAIVMMQEKRILDKAISVHELGKYLPNDLPGKSESLDEEWYNDD